MSVFLSFLIFKWHSDTFGVFFRVRRDIAAFEDGPTLDGAVSWTQGTWPPSFNGPKPSSGSQRCGQSKWSKCRMFILLRLFWIYIVNIYCLYLFLFFMFFYDCFSCYIFLKFHMCWMRCNVIYGTSCSQMASIYCSCHTLKVWGSREVDQNSVPTGVRNVETRDSFSVFSWCYPYTNSRNSNNEWNQLLQDDGRSHALEGWTERTWKHNKDLLVAQDGFRTVSNWELHVYASWVLT